MAYNTRDYQHDGKKVTFSILLPTYNREKLIKRAIESVLSQTYNDYELIVIDDGSTDDTNKVVSAYNDPRIYYYFKENGGQNSALNYGLQYANGKYIAFIDSDDAWLPKKLEKCLEAYELDKEVGVVYHYVGLKCENEKIRIAKEFTVEGWCQKEVLLQGYLSSPSFLSCKKECFEKIGLFDLNVINCQDDDLCFNLVKYYKVKLIREILGIYYYDANNRKGNNYDIKAESYYFLWKKHAEEVLEVCGSEELANKYYNAAERFSNVRNIKRTREAIAMAKHYSVNKKRINKAYIKLMCSFFRKKRG